jgi:hypothetical protein
MVGRERNSAVIKSSTVQRSYLVVNRLASSPSGLFRIVFIGWGTSSKPQKVEAATGEAPEVEQAAVVCS